MNSSAKEKLNRLAKMHVAEEEVIKTIQNPESLRTGYFGRKIAQSDLTSELALRVVYEEINNKILVMTIYSVKSDRYI